MAKKAYIGVNGIARKIKKGYVGVNTEVPVYEENTETVSINASNISNYFTVTNGSYYFKGSGSVFTTTNGGVNSSTASTVLTAKQDISSLTFNYSYSSEANYDKFTLKVGGTTVENAVSGSTKSKSYNGSLAKGETIEFSYVKDGSQHKNDDKCTFSAMVITAVVKTQISVEIKPIARKIKKAYVGVGGVARPFWGGGELTYYGTATDLSVARRELAGASVGNYALFAGGCEDGFIYPSPYATVDAYNTSLTRSTPTELSVSTSGFAGASVGNYALFAGGYWSSSVDAYNTSLTRSTPTALSQKRGYLAGASVGNYAIFAGGVSQYSTSEDDLPHAEVDAYDTSLTRSTPTELSQAACNLAGASVGNYALFAGGYGFNTSDPSIVNAYNTNLTRSTPTKMSVGRSELAGASVGDYALFAGGDSSSVVDAYNTNLTRSTPTALSVARYNLVGTSVGDYAVFAGGAYSSTYYSTVDAYNTNLTRSTPTALSVARYNLAGASVGDYAIFAGGYNDSTNYATVDVYTV